MTRTSILIAAVLLTSCLGPKPEAPDQATITVSASPDTKASTDESAISKLRIEVYNADGTMDTAGTFDEGRTPSLTVTCGRAKRIRVYANFTQDEPHGTIRLDCGLPDRLPMTGELICDIQSDTGIKIRLRRIVAKITVAGITNRTGHAITLDAVYLTNAVTALADSVAAGWSHRMGYERSPYDNFLHHSSEATLCHGDTVPGTLLFYTFPNRLGTDSRESVWCPRKTRVVLQATMLGHTYYYTVTMPGIAADTEYTIQSFIITKPGADNPEDAVEPDARGVSVTWSTWKDTQNEMTI